MIDYSVLDITNKTYNGEEVSSPYFAARINQKMLDRAKAQSYYAYILLQDLLTKHGKNLNELEINVDENGKPDFKNCNLHFNISHSGNMVFVAIADHPIGVDIQQKTKFNPRVAKRYFSAQEVDEILASADPDLEFTYAWSKLESQVKLLGSWANLKEYNSTILDAEKRAENFLSDKQNIQHKCLNFSDSLSNVYCASIAEREIK